MNAPAEPVRMRRQQQLLAQLQEAFSAGDAEGFDGALARALGGHESAVLKEMRQLSESLLTALSRFSAESRVATLATHEIPDARLRLDHVLKVTEEAAHTTLDLIEQSIPLADKVVRGGKALLDSSAPLADEAARIYVKAVVESAESVRKNLAEVMLAQGFQDLTGQILRGVQTLIGEVEGVLAEIARLTGAKPEDRAPVPGAALEGPAIPGLTRNAVSSQDDVDDLIAGLCI